MKRSDLLLKLQEILVEAPDDIEDAAEDILTRLEKLGLCPVSDDGFGNLLSLDYDPEEQDLGVQ